MSKNGNNAFMAFMKFYRQREAKKGINFASYEQVVQPAGEEWQRMSAEEKNYFRQCAKYHRAAPAPDNRCKLAAEKNNPTKFSRPNNDGNSERKIETKSCEVIQYSSLNDPQRVEMKTNVERKLTWRLMENFDVKILEKPFCVLTVESYEIAGKKEFPAEIAFVKFSLKEGIIAAKSFILQPTIKSHKIDPLNLSLATNRYRCVAEQIKSLCDCSDPCNFIFTLSSDFNEVQRAVKAIRQKINSQLFAPAEKITCVEDLYETLLRFKELKTSPHDLIRFNSIGKNCQWDKEVSIACSFHRLHTTPHCALAKARKMTYLLFNLLQEPYQLGLTTKHLPSDIANKDFDTPEVEQEIVEFDEEENLRRLAAEEMKKARRNGGRFGARLKPTPSRFLTTTDGDGNDNLQRFDFENDYSYTRKINDADSSMTTDQSGRNDFSSISQSNILPEDLIDFVGYDFSIPTSTLVDISMPTLNLTAAQSNFNYSVDGNIPMNRFADLSTDENITVPISRESTKIASNTTSINISDHPFLKRWFSENFICKVGI